MISQKEASCWDKFQSEPANDNVKIIFAHQLTENKSSYASEF